MATLLLAVAICTMGGAAQAVNGREETAVRDLLPIVKIETFAQLTERSSLRKLLQDHNAVNPSDLDRSVWYTAEFEAPETLGPWWLALGDRYFVRGLVVVIANLTNGSADVYSGVEILRTSQIFQDSFWLEQTNVEPGAKFKIYITKKIGNSDFGLLKLHMSTGTAKVEFFSSIHMINAGYTGLLLALLIYSLIFFVRLRSPLHGFLWALLRRQRFAGFQYGRPCLQCRLVPSLGALSPNHADTDLVVFRDHRHHLFRSLSGKKASITIADTAACGRFRSHVLHPGIQTFW